MSTSSFLDIITRLREAECPDRRASIVDLASVYNIEMSTRVSSVPSPHKWKRSVDGSCSCLKCKDLVLELAHRTSLLEAKGLGGLLETADHGRRAAEQDLDIVGGLGQPFLNCRNEIVSHLTLHLLISLPRPKIPPI